MRRRREEAAADQAQPKGTGPLAEVPRVGARRCSSDAHGTRAGAEHRRGSRLLCVRVSELTVTTNLLPRNRKGSRAPANTHDRGEITDEPRGNVTVRGVKASPAEAAPFPDPHR